MYILYIYKEFSNIYFVMYNKDAKDKLILMVNTIKKRGKAKGGIRNVQKMED